MSVSSTGLTSCRKFPVCLYYCVLHTGIFILLILLSSCKKDNSGVPPSNEITLNSKKLGTQVYYSMGYSFEKGDFFQRIGSSTDIDIYLVELLKPKGELDGVQFSTNSLSETTYGFYLNDQFQSLAAAEDFYNNYSLAYAPEYVTLTDTVKRFQVYTFRTWKSNYVKFLVKDIRVIDNGSPANYIEADIKYFIQQDGSENLAE